MKALITGAGGQVGRDLLATAPPEWTCAPLDRRTLDLTDPAAIRRAVDELAPDLTSWPAERRAAVDRRKAGKHR